MDEGRVREVHRSVRELDHPGAQRGQISLVDRGDGDHAQAKEGPSVIDLVRALSNEERLDGAVSISPLTTTTCGQTTTDDRADSDRSMGIAASDPPERLRRGCV